MHEKLPPHNLDAEESLLSAILIDNETLLDVLEILQPEDFYRTNHQMIYAAVIDLWNRSEPVDLITLHDDLKKKHDLASVGGAHYLAGLVDTIPMSVNAVHHARIIKEKSVARQLIRAGNEIVQKCYQNMTNAAAMIDHAEQAVFHIADAKTTKPYHHVSKLIEANFDTIDRIHGQDSQFTGVASGFNGLDNMTSGFQKSDLIIIAARPAVGKTTLALNIARNAAANNVPVMVFSLEMSREQLSMRILCSDSSVDSSLVRRGRLSADDRVKLTEAAGALNDVPLYIDDSPDITITSIRTKARRLKIDKGLGLIIIDYLQLMRGPAGSERRDLEISEISRSLKSLAKELDIPIIALSQLNRMLEQRSDKRPMLSDLRESGSIEQDSDVVIFIYRDELYNRDENNPEKGKAEVILGKHRNGPIGTAHLAFMGKYARFGDLVY